MKGGENIMPSKDDKNIKDEKIVVEEMQVKDEKKPKKLKFKAKSIHQEAPEAFKGITEASEAEKVAEQPQNAGKYRYYCDFCSNTGFIADFKSKGLVKTCKTCGKLITTKIENYFLIQ